MAQERAQGSPISGFHFSDFARRLANLSGRPVTFMLAAGLIVLWALSGPLFGFSDTWQLVVNTSTTIITFLMVFLIQNTQNRDTAAIQLKLDELIRATQGAHNTLIDLEEIEDEQIERYLRTYKRLAAISRARLEKGELDTDSPEVKELSGKPPGK
jgi:low affinity Fe/Cu permease